MTSLTSLNLSPNEAWSAFVARTSPCCERANALHKEHFIPMDLQISEDTVTYKDTMLRIGDISEVTCERFSTFETSNADTRRLMTELGQEIDNRLYTIQLLSSVDDISIHVVVLDHVNYAQAEQQAEQLLQKLGRSVFPSVVERAVNRIRSGRAVHIASHSLTRKGLTTRIPSLLWSRRVIVPYSALSCNKAGQIAVELGNGRSPMILQTPSAEENAILLGPICSAMAE